MHEDPAHRHGGLALAFEATADLGFEWHLDLQTGEILQLSGDAGIIGEDVVEEEQALRDRLETEPERYEQVPFASTREDFEVMERFAAGQPGEPLRGTLVGRARFAAFARRSTRFNCRPSGTTFIQRKSSCALVHGWSDWHHRAASRSATAVAEHCAPSPTLPGLVDLLLCGAKEVSAAGTVTLVITASSPQVSRRYFASLARSICEHVGQDWSASWRTPMIHSRTLLAPRRWKARSADSRRRRPCDPRVVWMNQAEVELIEKPLLPDRFLTRVRQLLARKTRPALILS